MIQKRMKHHRRYQEIINTFIKHGFSHFLFRIGLTERVSSRDRINDEHQLQLTNIGINLRHALQSLGPTFIKLGQIASSRRDLVPEKIALELEKLQDDVQSFSYDQVKEIIEAELGSAPEELFATFNEAPLATASIGQVHLARLHTGEEVAVKIQRPDIEKIIKTDLEILNNLARLLESRVEWARTYRIKEVIAEFSYSLRNELNYLLEGQNAERIYDQFEASEHIYIPKIFWEYTSDKVLTMEMIHGIKVNKYEQLQNEGYDCELLASRITDAMLHQILEEGFFHGDPHPGNIFVLPHNKVAFLDFGMVGRLNDDLKYYFSSLVISVQAGDTENIIRTFESWGLLDDLTDEDGLRRDIELLIAQYYERSLQTISLGKIIVEIFAIAYKYKIKVPSDIAILGKVILTLESILGNLDPNFSIMKAVEPYGKRLIMKRYHPRSIARHYWDQFIENMQILTELPKEMKEVANVVKKGKLQFDINLFELHYILKKFDRITNRLSFSVILLAFSILMSGMIIGASIAGQTTLLWRIPVIEIGSIVATLMFLLLLFVIIRSGRM